MVLTDLAYPSQPYNQLELSPEGGLLNVNQLKVTAIEPTEKVTGLNDPITSTSGENAQLRLVNGKIQIHTPNGNIYSLLGTRIL